MILGSPESGTAAFILQAGYRHFKHPILLTRGQFCNEPGVGEIDPILESSFRRMHNIDGHKCMIEIVATGGVNGAYVASRITSAEAAILLYSITSRSSIERLRSLHNEIMRLEYAQLPIALVGNDSKQQHEREVSTMEGKVLAKGLGCDFFEASANDRVNVKEPIVELVRKLLLHALSPTRRRYVIGLRRRRKATLKPRSTPSFSMAP
jgi:Ras family